MPLTPAHPAVVLPLQRLGLPLGALVAGAVAPDLPVFLPVGVGYATTHSGRGLPAALVIGLLLLWVWYAVLRDPVVDLTPGLRHRLPQRSGLERRAWLLAPVAVAVGAATHVLWDSATHDWGFVVERVALLRDEFGPLRLYGWLQHTSTVLGIAIVAAYGVARLRSLPAAPRPSAVRRPALWQLPVPVTVLVIATALADPEAGVGAGLVALLLVALGWRVVAARLRAATRAAPSR